MGRVHLRKSRQVLKRLDIRPFAPGKNGEVLRAALDRIDEIMTDPGERFFGNFLSENQKPGTLDPDICGRIDQVDTVDSGGGPLVKLAGDILHRNILSSGKVHRIRHRIGSDLSEDTELAFLCKRIGETEQVIDIDQSEGSQIERKILIELGEQAGSLDPELLFLFNK